VVAFRCRQPLGEYLAWPHAIHPDVVPTTEGGEIPCRGFDARLRDAVRGGWDSDLLAQRVGDARDGGQRRHVDDGAAARGDQMRPRGATQPKRPAEIHVEHFFPHRVGFVGKHRARPASGIVEDDMESAVSSNHLGHGRLDGARIGDVARDEHRLATPLADRGRHREASTARRASIPTLAPSFANRSAVAAPIPEREPLMRATFPSRRRGMSGLPGREESIAALDESARPGGPRLRG
jgi:hypothetical protein